MPTLADIHKEIRVADDAAAADIVRRKHLQRLHELTGRPTILYAAAFAVKDAPGGVLQIDRTDVQSFMSALCGIEGNQLDLIMHSPGGSAEATEQIVNYLRQKFEDIRVIVPQNAMSAATMLACAANTIVMGKHSALGPIDPQVVMHSHVVPAKSLLDEFHQARHAINNGDNPLLWVERLRAIPSGLLVDCEKVIKLAKMLVGDWLTKWMFAGDPEGREKALALAEWLGNNDNFLTHGRSIGMRQAREQGLRVTALEDDQDLQDAVLSAFHATVATFQVSPAVKIVENHLGRGSYFQLQQA